MRQLPVLLIVSGLLTLSLVFRPNPTGPSAATCPVSTEEDSSVTPPCRQVAHDVPAPEIKPAASLPPQPELLPAPTPDPQAAIEREPAKAIEMAKKPRSSEIMVGPDGVIYQRTSLGESTDR